MIRKDAMDDFRDFCDDFLEKHGSLHHPIKSLSRVGGEIDFQFFPAYGSSWKKSCGIAL
jgi:hypothetical protein